MRCRHRPQGYPSHGHADDQPRSGLAHPVAWIYIALSLIAAAYIALDIYARRHRQPSLAGEVVWSPRRSASVRLTTFTTQPLYDLAANPANPAAPQTVYDGEWNHRPARVGVGIMRWSGGGASRSVWGRVGGEP